VRGSRGLQGAGQQALDLFAELAPHIAVLQLYADALRPIAGGVRIDPRELPCSGIFSDVQQRQQDEDSPSPNAWTGCWADSAPRSKGIQAA
jgi:hypothetical protein